MKRIKRWLCAAACLALGMQAALAEDITVLMGSAGTFAVDETGAQVIPAGKYGSIYLVLSSPTRLAVADAETGLYAMFDEKGEPLTDFIYEGLYSDENGIYCTKDGLCGSLTPEGDAAVPCEYTCITGNGEGGYLALRTDPYDDEPDGVYRIDENGAETATGVKVTWLYAAMREGRLPARSADNGRYGYLGADGNWAVPPQFDYAGEFFGGLAQADISSGAGLIAPDGTWVLTPKYELVDTPAVSGTYRAAQGKDAVYLIENGSYRIAKTFENAAFSSWDGYIVVDTDESSMLFDPQGAQLLSVDAPGRISVWDLQDGCVVVNDGEWGEAAYYLCDMEGRAVSDRYQWIVYLMPHLYLVGTFEVETTRFEDVVLTEEVEGTQRLGVINERGEMVVAMEYDYITSPREGRLYLEKEGTGFLTDAEGTVLAEYLLP